MAVAEQGRFHVGVQISVKTSDIRGAGTDSNVKLTMFGKLEEKPTAGPETKLDNSGERAASEAVNVRQRH